MQAQDSTPIIRSLFDAVNRHDADKFVSHVDANVEWVDIPTGATFRGPDGVKQLAQRWWTAFPDNTVEVYNQIVSGDKAIVEYIARGTNTGPLDLPTGRVSPTGRRIEARFCDVYQITNGKIVSAHVYYDLATIMRQLGQLPTTKQAGA